MRGPKPLKEQAYDGDHCAAAVRAALYLARHRRSGAVRLGGRFLLGGIRSAGFASFGEKLRTLTVNSLLETNLGMPYVYAIFTAYSAKFTEQLRRRAHPLSFSARIAENNRERPGRARGVS